MDFVLLDVSFLIVHEVNQLPIAALVGLAPEMLSNSRTLSYIMY